MDVTVNGNSVNFREGMTAKQLLQTAGFGTDHHLALEMKDGTLLHIDDNEVVKPSSDDKFIAVPKAKKGIV